VGTGFFAGEAGSSELLHGRMNRVSESEYEQVLGARVSTQSEYRGVIDTAIARPDYDAERNKV
jgi:hypothetical protein